MEDLSLKSLVKSSSETLGKEIRFYCGVTSFYDHEKRNPQIPSVMLVTNDDEVYSIGYNNEYNILASSETNDRNKLFLEPKMVQELSGIGLRKIVITDYFGAALTMDGTIFFWADDWGYQNLDYKAVHMACNSHCIVFSTEDNHMFLWGYLYKEPASSGLEKITLPKDVKVQKLSAGWCHVAFLDDNGSVWTFGYGSVGQLGYSWNCSANIKNPRKVKLPGACANVECGSLSTVFLLKNGEVYACGRNERRDYLCVGRKGVVYKPMQVLLNAVISDIAAAVSMSSGGWRTLIAAYSKKTELYYKWGDDADSEKPQIVKDVGEMLDVFDYFRTPQSLSEVAREKQSFSNTFKITPPPYLEGKLYDGSIMKQWGVFDELTDKFISKVGSFRVYQDNYFDGTFSNRDPTVVGAYMITHDDEVFVIGFLRCFDKLFSSASENTVKTTTPIKIDILSKKHIKTILLDEFRGVALTSVGRLYEWSESQPLELVETRGGQRVTQIVGAIYRFHYCYLTEKNKVYYIRDGTVKIKTPSEKIIAIVAGPYHYAIQTEDLKIYTFSFSGEAKYDFLGYDWKTRKAENVAKRVKLPGPCKKVVCGYVATIFLMENGEVYGCGIKAGVEENVKLPQKLMFDEPIKDVDVMWFISSSTSAENSAFIGVGDSGIVYIWGVKRGDKPEAVEGVSSLIEMYERVGSPQISLKPTSKGLDSLHTRETVECNLYGDPLYSDICFHLSPQVIPAHKSILHIKSGLFRDKLPSNEANDDIRHYNIKSISAYLESLYTGVADDSSLALTELLDFTKLAKMDGNHHLVNDKRIIKKMVTYVYRSILQKPQ